MLGGFTEGEFPLQRLIHLDLELMKANRGMKEGEMFLVGTHPERA